MARILLIEDDDGLRPLFKAFLERRNHQVNDADNGVTGMDQLRRGQFDLVITDLVMPDKEGLETIIEIKAHQPALKIIAISGRANLGIDYLALAKKFGADEVLRKPFTAPELLESVDRVLAG